MIGGGNNYAMETNPESVFRLVTVINPQGFHARPADMFARVANQFRSHIEVEKDGTRVDGKSMITLLLLAATQGTQLRLEASGPDADAALNALATLFAQGFNEME